VIETSIVLTLLTSFKTVRIPEEVTFPVVYDPPLYIASMEKGFKATP
jgi:hypothetical protein